MVASVDFCAYATSIDKNVLERESLWKQFPEQQTGKHTTEFAGDGIRIVKVKFVTLDGNHKGYST